jgi:hypothetical protein
MPGQLTEWIRKVAAGETVKFRPRGSSMSGIVESGQLVTVVPITDSETIKKDDVVLCKVGGREYLHLVKAVRGRAGSREFQIGNNRGGTNGWTRNLYGKCIKVEP